MNILAIDPGYKQSALVGFNGVSVFEHTVVDNETMLLRLDGWKEIALGIDVLVIEQMQLFKSSFGVGQEVFDSVLWSGMFIQAWKPRRWDRLIRSKVRGHLGASKGGDAAVRAALIQRFGPYKETAIGKKSTPGPLFGVTSHEWQALALAVVYHDLHGHEDPARVVRPGIQAEF